MKKLMITGAVFCAFALAPLVPANAVPIAPASGLSQIDSDTVLVKGGHGRGHGMGRGNRGRHYGWSRGRHRGWR